MRIYYCDVNADHPDWVGVSEIDVIATRPDRHNDEKCAIGQYVK